MGGIVLVTTRECADARTDSRVLTTLERGKREREVVSYFAGWGGFPSPHHTTDTPLGWSQQTTVLRRRWGVGDASTSDEKRGGSRNRVETIR